MSKCISTAQARRKCVSAFWAHSGLGIFLYEVALVTSPFRLRRLAQGVSLRSGLGHFACQFPYKVALRKSSSAFRLRSPVCSCITLPTHSMHPRRGSLGFACFASSVLSRLVLSSIVLHFRSIRCIRGGDHCPALSCSVLGSLCAHSWLGHVSAFWAHSGLGHVSCKFLYKVVFVKSPSAFRLRRLVHSVGRGLGIGPPPQNHHPQHHHLLPPQHHHSQHHHLPPPWHHHPHHPPAPHHPRHHHPKHHRPQHSDPPHRHHRHHPHSHALSSHSPTLFGASCRDNKAFYAQQWGLQ